MQSSKSVTPLKQSVNAVISRSRTSPVDAVLYLCAHTAPDDEIQDRIMLL